MAPAETSINPKDWLLLVVLSILWGGSFFFIAVAVKELPPFTIVFARVALATAILLPVHWIIRGQLPWGWRNWLPFLVMALLNNVIPFSLIVTGQTLIPSGLASVINATTPLFGTIIMASFGNERLIPRKLVGIAAGIGGVFLLRGPALETGGAQTVGMLLCLVAAASYGFAGLWGRRRLDGVAPLTSATCQLLCSFVIMALLAAVTDRPWQLPPPSISTWAALMGLAILATAVAYIIYFNILARSGASHVLLVTLLLPVTAILLGYSILGEQLNAREILGALIVGGSLLIIDGRVLGLLRARDSG